MYIYEVPGLPDARQLDKLKDFDLYQAIKPFLTNKNTEQTNVEIDLHGDLYQSYCSFYGNGKVMFSNFHFLKKIS